MIKLQELITGQNTNRPTAQTPTESPDEEVEKLAQALEQFAEEDTLLTKLAELAVLTDFLEGKYGK